MIDYLICLFLFNFYLVTFKKHKQKQIPGSQDQVVVITNYHYLLKHTLNVRCKFCPGEHILYISHLSLHLFKLYQNISVGKISLDIG